MTEVRTTEVRITYCSLYFQVLPIATVIQGKHNQLLPLATGLQRIPHQL